MEVCLVKACLGLKHIAAHSRLSLKKTRRKVSKSYQQKLEYDSFYFRISFNKEK